MNVTNIEQTPSPVKQKLLELLDDVLRHDG
jgi:hypothetical protein